ncbi:hypothetical protein BJ508DRAFT_311849 [Ascobolus immersus RN42]|uniref:Uncharacterized protein n=1 Tax=Ascobolus immersus RN42 TaxID=1160509 RepID=A0A3N4HUP5_ASCIM|nr:hypothetical protein BJ508DRAFT_311849 [Ascobolus immersus RN42]
MTALKQQKAVPRQFPDLLMPTRANIPDSISDYQPIDLKTASWLKGLIEDYWHIYNITSILLPTISKVSAAHYEPAVFRIETSDGAVYEYTHPTWRDRSAGPHLLRPVHPNGNRGKWYEGPYEAEATEKQDRRLERAGFGSGRQSVTLELMASVAGLEELEWMRLIGMKAGHAAMFFLSLGRPAIETEDQKEAFTRRFMEHAEVCKYEKRRCV